MVGSPLVSRAGREVGRLQAVPYGVLGLAVIPVPDLPPLPLGLIWRTATEGVKVRALTEVARSAGPWPTDAPV